MAIKKINYDASLKYYLKDNNGYERKQCHVNTFQKFYDFNYEEVEKNEDAFKYVVGLFIGNDGDKPICYIHSWVEKNNEVIDVTPFANVFITNENQLNGDEYEEFVRQVSGARYMPIKTISNKAFNKELNTRFRSLGYTQRPESIVENMVREWINEAEHDPRVKYQIENFGLTFIRD